MTKKQEYMRIAKDAGIKSPDVEYMRERQAYRIGIVIPVPDSNTLRGVGFRSATVGVYSSFEEAREKITADLLGLVQRYPQALDEVTSAVASRIEAELAVTNPYYNVTDDAQRLTILLQAIMVSSDTMAITEQEREAAKRGLAYIRDLKAKLPPEVAQGNYHSRYPDQPKQPIDWQQPQARQHPVYEFEVDCPYCGKTVKLERYSPREPQHCGEDACEQQHQRLLARERKRRQRKRQMSQ